VGCVKSATFCNFQCNYDGKSETDAAVKRSVCKREALVNREYSPSHFDDRCVNVVTGFRARLIKQSAVLLYSNNNRQ